MIDHKLELQRIEDSIREKRYADATGIILDLLDENPEDYIALFKLGQVLLKDHKKGLAFNVLARAAKLNPDEPGIWIAYSQAHRDHPNNWGKIEWCLKNALGLYKKQGRNPSLALGSLGMLYYIKNDISKARKYCQAALDEDANVTFSQTAMSFVNLASGEWEKAWHHYDNLLGAGKGQRENVAFGDEPQWDGKPVRCLAITGEQGIGDELMYASCINEAIEDCGEVVIECMPRLEGLFKRSFPKAYVYGQRWHREVFWQKDHRPDAHVAMATLPRFYRHKDSDFPGNSYLTADHDMKAAMRGVLDQFSDKPKIGIAWTGGSARTRGYLRKRTLEEMLPVLRKDFCWISLEYNDASEEIEEFYKKRGISILQVPWATAKGLNYDLTAALIDELDLVISVPTTAVQMAGALGKECWVIVPKYTGWIFYRDVYPWASSVKPFRNPPMKKIADELDKWPFRASQISRPLSLIG